MHPTGGPGSSAPRAGKMVRYGLQIGTLAASLGALFPFGGRSHSYFRRVLNMSLDTSRGSSSALSRWKWVLYVALALFGGSITFVAARAQQKATEEATFRKL